MGWCRGSDIAVGVINAVRRRVKNEETRAAIYRDVINELDNHDWDTHDDAIGYDPVFDQVMQEMDPDVYIPS